MMAAHAFEMLLKAAIYEHRKTVTFSGSDRSYDLGKCITVAETSLHLIAAGDRVVLQALKEDRDTATHDVIAMSEDVLWLHLRSSVTIFRKVLHAIAGQDLADVMPGRVLPVSAQPPTDVGLVFGKEMEQIASLLRPGKRRTAEARALVLPMIALDRAARSIEGPAAEREIADTLKALKLGAPWNTIFPGIVGLHLVGGPRPSEQVQEITLRIDPKRGELAIRPAAAGEDADPYREVNTFDKYSIRLSDFGAKLGLSQNQGYAVIHALGLKKDAACYTCRKTRKGNIGFQGLSNVALNRASQALKDGLDLGHAVQEYKASIRSRSTRATPTG